MLKGISIPYPQMDVHQDKAALKLEKSVGSRKSMQALDAAGKPKNLLITNKVTTHNEFTVHINILLAFPAPN